MTDTSNRGLKFTFFLVGISVPLAVLAIWLQSVGRKREVDKAHDITVEDSFPASDPPSAW